MKKKVPKVPKPVKVWAEPDWRESLTRPTYNGFWVSRHRQDGEWNHNDRLIVADARHYTVVRKKPKARRKA